MRQTFSTILGKSVKSLAQLRGGGSALPGLFVEKIDPDYIKRTLTVLPKGVVLISGTNGKTTTTKMVVELLKGQGLKVFTNRTGSNFTRGVAAALLGSVDSKGVLDADIAVLELDEAHAVHFVKAVQPTYALLLNVMRDQLDRFGEIDKTAELLSVVATNTTGAVVINGDDPRLNNPAFTNRITANLSTYDVSSKLQSLFPSDDDMRESEDKVLKDKTVTDLDNSRLDDLSGQKASISFGGHSYSIDLQLKGIYNVQNAVGAIAITRRIMDSELSVGQMLTSLSQVKPAFGRGESIKVKGKECEIVLVKNPSGFRLSLSSFDPKGFGTMIAINDDYADGRDMSWLWDVDFETLKAEGVSVVSGIRAYDMALRLQYDEVEMVSVEPNLAKALDELFETYETKPVRIFCTYTAMLAIRKILSKSSDVEIIR